MIPSRVTLATIDAAAIENERESPRTTVSTRQGSSGARLPSTSAAAGRRGSVAKARGPSRRGSRPGRCAPRSRGCRRPRRRFPRTRRAPRIAPAASPGTGSSNRRARPCQGTRAASRRRVSPRPRPRDPPTARAPLRRSRRRARPSRAPGRSQASAGPVRAGAAGVLTGIPSRPILRAGSPVAPDGGTE